MEFLYVITKSKLCFKIIFNLKNYNKIKGLI